MKVVVSGSEILFDRGGIGAIFQHLAGAVAANLVLQDGASFIGNPVSYAKEIQCVHRIGRHGNAGPDLAKFDCLFEHAHRYAEMLQRKRGSQSADAAADDHDRRAEILASIYRDMRWMLLAHHFYSAAISLR